MNVGYYLFIINSTHLYFLLFSRILVIKTYSNSNSAHVHNFKRIIAFVNHLMEPVIFAKEWPILKNIVGFGRLLVKRKKRKEIWEYWKHKSTLELRNENANEDLEISCEVYDINLFFIPHKISQENKIPLPCAGEGKLQLSGQMRPATMLYS